MTDISVNRKVTIDITGEDGTSCTLSGYDFAFEGDPISIARSHVANMEIDLNGNPVTYSDRRPFEIALSFLPDSNASRTLYSYLYASRTGTASELFMIKQMVVKMGDTQVIYKNGRVVEGPYGPSVTAEGRKSNVTYRILFSTCL